MCIRFSLRLSFKPVSDLPEPVHARPVAGGLVPQSPPRSGSPVAAGHRLPDGSSAEAAGLQQRLPALSGRHLWSVLNIMSTAGLSSWHISGRSITSSIRGAAADWDVRQRHYWALVGFDWHFKLKILTSFTGVTPFKSNWVLPTLLFFQVLIIMATKVLLQLLRRSGWYRRLRWEQNLLTTLLSGFLTLYRQNKYAHLHFLLLHAPLQQRPNDYGIPVAVEVTYVQDNFLTSDVLNEMVRPRSSDDAVKVVSKRFSDMSLGLFLQMLLVDFYRGAPDLVQFTQYWCPDTTMLDKIKVRQLMTDSMHK